MPLEPRFKVFWPPKLLAFLGVVGERMRQRGGRERFLFALRAVNYRLNFEADSWGTPVTRGPDAGTRSKRHEYLWVNDTLAQRSDGLTVATVVRLTVNWHSGDDTIVEECSLS